MLAVQIGELLQNSFLKVMQRLPRHLGAFKIAPCPSLSVLLLCRAGAAQLRGPEPGHPFMAKSCLGCGVCAGFVEAAGGNNLLLLQGRAGTWW